MTVKTWSVVAICAVAIAGGIAGPLVGLAEDDLFDPPPEQIRGRVKTMERTETRVSAPALHMASGQPDFRHEIEQAAKTLHGAQNDEAKENAERKLTELLNKYFEEDMERREQELANVEQRVKNLGELLAKRRNKRSEIIDLQIKVLENEADGLGFFNSSSPTRQGYGSLFVPSGPGGDGQRWNIHPPLTPPTSVPGGGGAWGGGGSGSGSGFIFSDGNSSLQITGTVAPPAEIPAPPRAPLTLRAARPAATPESAETPSDDLFAPK